MSTPQTLGFTMKLINFTELLKAVFRRASKVINPLISCVFFLILILLVVVLSGLAWIGFFADLVYTKARKTYTLVNTLINTKVNTWMKRKRQSNQEEK